MMPSLKRLLQALADTLAETGQEYFIYGGVACNVWAEPRATQDVDLVLCIPQPRLTDFLRAAHRHGFAVDEDLVFMNIGASGWTRIPLGPTHIDVTISSTEFDQQAVRRSVSVRVFERDLSICTKEDLILYKLIAAREKDLADVGRIFLRHGMNLDSGYLRSWAGWLSEALQQPSIVDELERRLAAAGPHDPASTARPARP